MIVEQSAMEYLSDNKMRGESLRVLNRLVAKAGFYNTLPSTKKVAKQLDMKLSNVDRAFRELCQYRVLIKDDDNYILNPRFYWKGNTKQRQELIARLESDGVKL